MSDRRATRVVIIGGSVAGQMRARLEQPGAPTRVDVVAAIESARPVRSGLSS